MKLEENRYTDKKGVDRVSYRIKKMNEYGNGLLVDTKVDFTIKFPPRISTVNFKDKQGNPKSFESVNIVAGCDTEFENVELNEYQTAAYQLPPNYAPWVKDCKEGDTITVWLRSFEKTVEGKVEKRTAWDCDINGVNVKEGSSIQKKIEDEEVVKEVIAKPVQEVANSEYPEGSVQRESPANKTPDIPEELKEWSQEVLKNKEAFYKHFCTDDVLKMRGQPTAFIEWMMHPEQCDTEFVIKAEGDKNLRATSLFWALIAMFEGNQ